LACESYSSSPPLEDILPLLPKSMRDSIKDRKKEQKKRKEESETEICREDFCLLTYTYPLKTKHEREREREKERERERAEAVWRSFERLQRRLDNLDRDLFFYLILIPNTYQNGTVLVSVENPNLSQNGAILILILIFFFLQEDILVTYHCQNDIILIFPSTLIVILTEGAKMQLFGCLGGYYITFETSGG
jgi:hypothetical protein